MGSVSITINTVDEVDKVAVVILGKRHRIEQLDHLKRQRGGFYEIYCIGNAGNVWERVVIKSIVDKYVKG